jgi:hypothetical protein
MTAIYASALAAKSTSNALGAKDFLFLDSTSQALQ